MLIRCSGGIFKSASAFSDPGSGAAVPRNKPHDGYRQAQVLPVSRNVHSRLGPVFGQDEGGVPNISTMAIKLSFHARFWMCVARAKMSVSLS